MLLGHARNIGAVENGANELEALNDEIVARGSPLGVYATA